MLNLYKDDPEKEKRVEEVKNTLTQIKSTVFDNLE
jgi:hypothetical protein